VHAVPGSPQPGVAAYNAIAAGYDGQVQGDDWMRRVLHAHYARVFSPGMRVLDVGCGTGIDALALAGHGMQVVAIDFAPGMITELRRKISRFEKLLQIEPRVLGVEQLHQLRGERFDGLISAFAALSTLDDLGGFATTAAELVRPGGHLVLHMLNRFSTWEWLGYFTRCNWTAARQVGRLRTREFTIGGEQVRHRLYFAYELYAAVFAQKFALCDAYALGALRPPHTVQRLPGPIVQTLEWLDVRTGRWPLLRDAGRFFVLDMQRLAT
jgi:ubiquinone/menaquinone biosynthesis C-methylase UbiE